MKKNLLFICIFVPFNILFAQGYQGPAQGSVDSGVVVTTSTFLKTAQVPIPQIKNIRNEIEYDGPAVYDNSITPILPAMVKYVNDRSLSKKIASDTAQTILLNSFHGLNMTNSIPPDPYIAVGPNYIMATVNSRFAIWDKQGNLVQNIDANSWYSSALPNVSAFDPKILYDHFDKRWIMVWLDQDDKSERGNFLLSISDDEDPNGIWYNWVLPSTNNGNTGTSTWGDYEGVGFNKDAIFITSNQFSFTGAFKYSKIRIIPKEQLYANTAGQVNWFDIWNVKYPNQNSAIFSIRPSISYSDSSDYYLLHAPNGGGNFLTLLKIVNPIDSPSVSSVNVSIGYYNPAPNAEQLGGGSPQIEGSGSALRNEPTYRDGYLWAVHSIQNPTSSKYSCIDYVKIDVNTNKTVENYRFGDTTHWYYYSALAVDKNENVAITYSRSGADEYIGSFYSTRLKNDPSGFSSSKLLQEGKGNYVVTFSGDRNRWGDYSGMWLDPENEQNIWMFSENAAASNTWGTWVGEIRMVPFEGVYAKADSLNFGSVEINSMSDTNKIILTNFGKSEFIITGIPDSSSEFKLVSDLTFPITLNSYDSLELNFTYNPKSIGDLNYLYPVTSNDSSFQGFLLKGKGYFINAANEDQLYASSGQLNNGNILTIDLGNGQGTTLGSSLFKSIESIAINPVDKIMYGIYTTASGSSVLRVNSTEGDAYNYFDIDVPNISSIAFDNKGKLYAAKTSGEIYKIDLNKKTYSLVATVPITIAGMAFNPKSNELWASILDESPKDRIFKINLTNGDTTLIGRIGVNRVVSDLVFDGEGNLFGVLNGTSVTNFISIDTSTIKPTIIGVVGYKDITGLTIKPKNLTVGDKSIKKSVPSEFTLSQNFPNPFNPSTTIEYGLPKAASVRVIIYDLLGEVVKELVNDYKPAGSYKVKWNSDDKNGSKVSSGIYFYELKVSGDNGRELSFIKKMILLK